MPILDDIKAGVKSWQSRAWILERRFPMDFAIGSQELAQLKLEIESLKGLIMDVVMEESPIAIDPGFAWSDGRRSVWRDIQNTMIYIDQLLEENDGSK